MAGGQTLTNGQLYKLEPAAVDRAVLEAAPRERTVQAYLPTRAAQRTLALLAAKRDSHTGDFFWLHDPPGAGKTHFLNYYLALRQRLAGVAEDGGRELSIVLDYAKPETMVQLESDILAALARALGGERRATPLWRRIGADAAFEVAMNEARRSAARAITVAIDLGANPTPPFAGELVRIARASSRPNLIVVAAGLGSSPQDAVASEVGPAGLAERLVVAVGRARRLDPRWTAMANLYRGVEIAPLAAEEIFPFQPQTLSAISALYEPETAIGPLSRTLREVLTAHKDPDRLVYPCDIFEASEVRQAIEQRLGAGGRAALRSAPAAALSMPRGSRQRNEQIVRTLAIAYLCEPAPALEIDQLWSRLPPAGVAPRAASSSGAFEELQTLAERSAGAIQVTPAGAAFVPASESTPDIEAFNRAIALLKLFEPTLVEVHSVSELPVAKARLVEALSNLIEEARVVNEALQRFASACRSPLEPEVVRALHDCIDLAERGAEDLFKRGADETYLRRAQGVIGAYRELAAAAASVPGLLAMKDYLQQTRLEAESFDSQSPSQAAALATERRLLEAELGARAPYSRAREALEGRFEKFKWTYVENYRVAHEQWRAEMEQASALVIDIDRGVQAVVRLNSLTALGEPVGAELEGQARLAREAIKVCRLNGQFSASSTALCPVCGYVLGTPAPTPALAKLLEKTRRALREKFTALSRGAIVRLIRKYDRAHRLDGFLKITQAAQTEALAAVLDDQLTAYLARLLKEGGESARGRRSGR
jgi:hypothetical protein